MISEILQWPFSEVYCIISIEFSRLSSTGIFSTSFLSTGKRIIGIFTKGFLFGIIVVQLDCSNLRIIIVVTE